MKKSFKIMSFFFSLLVVALAFAAVGMPELFGAAGLLLATPLILANYEDSNDAKQKRNEIHLEMEKLIALRKEEKRSFTSDEDKKYTEMRADFDKLTAHIKELEADEKRRLEMAGLQAKKTNQEKEREEIRKYSFLRVVQAQLEGRKLDGLEAEMEQEGKAEHRNAGIADPIEGIAIPSLVFRSMTATGQTTTAGDQGGNWVPTEKAGLVEALRPFLVLNQLGANFISGLQGNVDFPKGNSFEANWNTETGTSNDITPGTGIVPMSPKRLEATVSRSRQILLQSSPDVDAYLLRGLYAAIYQALERAAIAGGGANQPTGILATTGIGSVIGGDNGAAPTYAHMVELETKIAQLNADIGALNYLTNSKVRGKLKTTLKDAAVAGHVWEPGNTINGYNVGVTNLVPGNLTKGTATEVCSAIIFGNFNDLVIGNWGGMDLVVDPYSLKKQAKVEITANTFWDSAVLRPESFSAMMDALTA